MFLPIEYAYSQEEGLYNSREPAFSIEKVGDNIRISMLATNFHVVYDKHFPPSVHLTVSLLDDAGSSEQSSERLRKLGKLLINLANEADKKYKETWGGVK